MLKNYFDKISAHVKNINLPFVQLAVLVVLIVGLILRVKIYLFNQGLWGDEIALVGSNFMKRSYLELFQPLNNNQVAPPLFLIFSKLFFEVGKSINAWLYADLGAKLFSLICSVLSVFGFYFLLNKVFKNKIYTTICLLLFCLNPIALSYAQEVKQYSTDLLFSIMLIYIFYSVDFKKDSIRKISIYSSILALSLWFSTSAPFVITAGFCYLIFDLIKNKTCNEKHLIFFIPFVLSFLIWIFAFYIPVKEFNYSYMFNFWGRGARRFLCYNTFGIFNDGIKELTSFSCILPCFISGILILLFKKEYKILVLTGLPVLFCAIASYMQFYPFELRLILFLLPSLIIISTSFLLFVEENKKSCCILLIFTILATILQFEHSASRNIYFKTDIRKQVDYVIKNKNQYERIFTYHIGEFEYYSKLLNANFKYIGMTYPFETEETNKLINSLEKNKTHILLIPTLAGLSKEFPIKTKMYMENNKNIEIIETITSSYGNDNNAVIMKFKTK